MGLPAKKPVMTAEEYLAWEETQLERHDFVNGEVYAMAGAEEGHVTVCGNLYMALRQHLAGTPCRTFITDMKLHPAEHDSFFYPDVLVTCSPNDRQSSTIKREPCLIVEVLSASTAAYDRGDKFAHYRAIPTLQEVAFVDIPARRVEVFRRGADGLFVLHPFEEGQPVELRSVDLRMTTEVVFAELEDLNPDAESVPEGSSASSAPATN
jgi:Uma2 family endonuclease